MNSLCARAFDHNRKSKTFSSSRLNYGKFSFVIRHAPAGQRFSNVIFVFHRRFVFLKVQTESSLAERAIIELIRKSKII